jgi:hypothetical protein
VPALIDSAVQSTIRGSSESMIAENSPVNGQQVDYARRPSHDTSESREGTSFEEPASPGSSAADLVAPLLSHLAELRDSARLYLSVRIDQWRSTGRHLLMQLIMLIVGGIFAAAALVTSAVLFVNGLATGLGVLLGGRTWIGQVVVGGALILAVFGCVVWGARYLRIAEHQQLVTKYEPNEDESKTEMDERAVGTGSK